MTRSIVDRVSDIYARHGIAGSLRLVPNNINMLLRSVSPARRRAWRRDLEFDRLHGIDTAAPLFFSSMDVPKDIVRHGQPYRASGIDFTRRQLQMLSLPFADFSFIDLGAGKGRTLLLASHLPFRRVIGVEFSPELTAIARKNIATYRSPDQQCRDIQFVCADAGSYGFPSGPLAIYLYNPFDDVILARVMKNLEAALQAEPRDVVLVYVYPVHRPVIDAAPFLALQSTHDGGMTVVYRATGRAP